MKISNLLILILCLNFTSLLEAKNCIDDKLVIAATGDTIFHGSLLVQAFRKDKSGGFDNLWKETIPYLQQADLMYTNLEGPVASGLFANGKEDLSLAEVYHPTNGMYSVGEAGKSYTFNFHPESVRALKKSGFTLMSTANNHTLDRGLKGLNKTLDFLNQNHITHFGSKYNMDSDERFVAIIKKNNISLAFVGCTYGSNINVKSDQVLKCYKKGQPNRKLLNLVRLFKDRVDAVIVTPHWGDEYADQPTRFQKKLAKALVGVGAKAIIGHHPHIIQPVEYFKNDEGVKVPVLYSLGNFVTNQAPSNWRDKKKNESRFKRRVGAVAFLGFDNYQGQVSVKTLKVMPTYMKIQYEGQPGMRTLVPAYSSLYSSQKGLAKSLDKAMSYFKTKYSNEILSIDNINRGIVCR